MSDMFELKRKWSYLDMRIDRADDALRQLSELIDIFVGDNENIRVHTTKLKHAGFELYIIRLDSFSLSQGKKNGPCCSHP